MQSNRRQFLSSTAGVALGAPFTGALTQQGVAATKKATGNKREPARQLDTGLFFDVEDIFSPPELGNDDSIKELATILTEEGLRGNFLFIGDRALVLKKRGRKDVIDSLGPHDVGLHTRSARHPEVPE